MCLEQRDANVFEKTVGAQQANRADKQYRLAKRVNRFRGLMKGNF